MTRARDLANSADLSFDGLTVDTNTLHVDSSNNRVGIGTTSPATKLHIYSSIPDIRLEDSNTNALAELRGNTGTGSFVIATDVNNAISNSKIIFEVDNDEKVRIDNNGDLGIGTNNPSQKLHVSSSDHTRVLVTAGTDKYAEIQFENDAQKFAMGVQNDDKFFLYNTTGTTQVLTVDTSSNVGINTQSPGSRKLKIVGSSSAYPLALDSTDTDYALEFQKNGVSEWWLKASASNFKIHENGVGDHLSIATGGAITGSSSITATTTVNVGTGGGFYLKQDSSESTIRSESQPIVLQTYSSAWQDRLTVLNSGNVGIGTNSPGQLLEVNGSGATIRVESTDNNQQGIEFYQSDTKNASIMWGQGSANLEIKNFRNDQHADNLYANIDFYTGGSNATSPNYNPEQAMRITDDQNVIIGGGGQTSEKLLIKTTQSGGGLQIAWSDGGSPSNGQTLGSIGFQGYSNGNSNASADAKIQATVAANHSGSSAPTHLDFYTKDDSIGPGSAPTRRFRIDEQGGAHLYASKNNWSMIAYPNSNVHYRLYGASSSTTTYDLLRYKRHYWGSGSVHITLFQTYYSSTSQGEYWLAGHGRSSGSYTPNYSLVYRDIYNGPGSGRLSTNMPGGAPGNSDAEIVDVSISIPAYVYYLVKIQVSHSQFYPTTTVMGQNNSYALHA